MKGAHALIGEAVAIPSDKIQIGTHCATLDPKEAPSSNATSSFARRPHGYSHLQITLQASHTQFCVVLPKF